MWHFHQWMWHFHQWMWHFHQWMSHCHQWMWIFDNECCNFINECHISAMNVTFSSKMQYFNEIIFIFLMNFHFQQWILLFLLFNLTYLPIHVNSSLMNVTFSRKNMMENINECNIFSDDFKFLLIDLIFMVRIHSVCHW